MNPSVLLVVCLAFGISQVCTAKYAVYVWRDGWDANVEGCDAEEFLRWDNEACFTHSWNTPDKRQWLFDTCSRSGREIKTVYLYDMQHSLALMDCNEPSVQYIRETIAAGKAAVPDLQIYGLLSIGGAGVPEQDWVKYFVWYNENCITDAMESIDGVAVNNEDYDRGSPEADKVAYLDNLQKVADEANKQQPAGSLKTHYSVGWVWGRDDEGGNIEVTWNGERKYIMHHFIDIFDSIDTQVAFITADAMQERLEISGYSYAQETNKQMLATVYLNQAFPCQTTFFPFPEDDPDCVSWSHGYKTEEAMFEQLDSLQEVVEDLEVVLHYFRGTYSSGGYPGWPNHQLIQCN